MEVAEVVVLHDGHHVLFGMKLQFVLQYSLQQLPQVDLEEFVQHFELEPYPVHCFSLVERVGRAEEEEEAVLLNLAVWEMREDQDNVFFDDFEVMSFEVDHVGSDVQQSVWV